MARTTIFDGKVRKKNTFLKHDYSKKSQKTRKKRYYHVPNNGIEPLIFP